MFAKTSIINYMLLKIKVFSLLIFSFFIYSNEIEEIVVTGTFLKDAESDLSPVQVISESNFKNFNITNIGEISKYLNISSGSRFQTNALEGVDQGMSSITLRGLDASATLLLVNSKRRCNINLWFRCNCWSY